MRKFTPHEQARIALLCDKALKRLKDKTDLTSLDEVRIYTAIKEKALGGASN